MKICVTSWHRTDFLYKVLETIAARTHDPHVIVYDNGSDPQERLQLVEWHRQGFIHDLLLSNRNAGVTLPKRVFHELAKFDGDEFYVVTDNDFLCPVGWLDSLIDIMRRHPDLGVLAPQYWPQWPMETGDADNEVVYCRAIGNTFKLVRTEAADPFFRQTHFSPYGDDGALSHNMAKNGWRLGFCRDVWCYNLEQTMPNWGYKNGEERCDPRRAQGYAAQPEPYTPVSWETLEPPEHLKWRPGGNQ